MNIIFLDVDGVLNTYSGFGGISYLEPNCLENLQKLVRATNAKIVVSSSWRMHDSARKKLIETLKDYDLDKDVIGWTPILGTFTVGPSRGHEIWTYMSTLLNWPDNFIILDDDKIYMDDFLPNLVKVNGWVGLTEENVKEAIAKLSGPIESDYKRTFS